MGEGTKKYYVKRIKKYDSLGKNARLKAKICMIATAVSMAMMVYAATIMGVGEQDVVFAGTLSMVVEMGLAGAEIVSGLVYDEIKEDFVNYLEANGLSAEDEVAKYEREEKEGYSR